MSVKSKDVVGVAKLCVVLPVALASVGLGVSAKLVVVGWTNLQRTLYAGRRARSSTSKRPSATSKRRHTSYDTSARTRHRSGVRRSGY